MAQTVAQVLAAATNSVTLINAINGGTKDVSDMTQAQINAMVKRNVDHLGTILTYDGTHEQPNVAGSADDKTSYTTAITVGNQYITDNS